MKTTSKKDLYSKASKINNQYVNLSTIERKFSPEIVSIIKVIRSRIPEPKLTVKQFCDNLIKERLYQIAKNLPDEGYSMGSKITVTCKGLLGMDDRRDYYSKSCKYSETHGSVFLRLTPEELRNTKVIGNLVTYIYPDQKRKIKKCYWYSSEGRKQHFNLTKVEGFLYCGYHSLTREGAKIGGTRILEYEKEQRRKVANFNKALRLQYSFQDSLKAGNCEAGTRAFVLRLQLDINKKYRGTYLLAQAKEKSSNSIPFVERMIRYKVQ